MDNTSKLSFKAETLRLRANMILELRRFFLEREFLEVETPVRIPEPAPETHIDAVSSEAWFLQTSPELCMKRLLAAGYTRIFQICKCFRSGERGDLHLPEFTMLEWYRSGADYCALMDDCESLIAAVARELGTGGAVSWQGLKIGLNATWERITVKDAFERYAAISITEALRTDRFDEVLACEIAPKLGMDVPVFLYDYPSEQGALARLKEKNPAIAERFELFIGGMEIANAFSELTDPGEQRRRFEEARDYRRREGNPTYPMPERFLEILPQLPPSAGIALGVDRLVMFFTDKARIDDVVAFTPESL